PVTAPGDGGQVSSTRLRALLQAGDMPAVRRLLGRPHGFRGRVVMGERRGRTLGFPTANLHVRAGLLLPPDGVYAVSVELDGRPPWPYRREPREPGSTGSSRPLRRSEPARRRSS